MQKSASIWEKTALKIFPYKTHTASDLCPLCQKAPTTCFIWNPHWNVLLGQIIAKERLPTLIQKHKVVVSKFWIYMFVVDKNYSKFIIRRTIFLTRALQWKERWVNFLLIFHFTVFFPLFFPHLCYICIFKKFISSDLGLSSYFYIFLKVYIFH